MRCLNRWALLLCLLVLLSTGAFAQEAQYRAFWVDTFNSNLNTPADVQTVVANARAANANAIFAQVRRRGDSWYLIGGEGLPDGVLIQPNFDPLQALIQEAHNWGIEMHAYVIVNAIYNKHPTVTGLPSNPNHVFNLHAWDPVTKAIRTDSKNWLTRTTLPDTPGTDTSIRFNGYRFSSDFWIDLGHPAAAAYTANLFTDLVRNYDIDGLHLDRIRYPDITVPSSYPKQTAANGTYIGYNSTNVARYNRKFGKPDGYVPPANEATWSQWRRDQVSNFVRRVYLNAIAINPKIKISASTIVYGDAPDTWTGAEAYWRVYQDWRAWLEEGILDVNVPMNYKTEHSGKQPDMLDHWNEFFRNNQYNRMTISGLGVYLNYVECSLRQMRRTLLPSASTGNTLGGLAFFSMANSSYKNSTWNKVTTYDPCSIPPNDAYPYGRQLPFAEFAAAVTTGKSADGTKQYEDPVANPLPVFARSASIPDLPWKANPQTGHLMGFIKDETGKVVDAGDFAITRLDDGTTPATGRTQVPNASTVAIPTTDGSGFYGGVDLAAGQYRVTITPTGQAAYTSCPATVNVGQVTSFDFTIDRQKPTTTLEATPKQLWPPDHHIETVTVSGTATDVGTGLDSITFQVVDDYGLVQPEIAQIDGWGSNSLDWSVAIPLEASRIGQDKDGRNYTIQVTLKDRACNVTTMSTTVSVDHDQRDK
jgi:uncharacterized lipoprotein YddW (UPF0748 family)